MAKRVVTDTFDMDAVAEFLGVPTYMDIWEGNADYLGDAYSAGVREALAEGASEEEAEETGVKWQEAEEKELHSKYMSGLESAAASVLEPHGLVLEDTGKGKFKVIPESGWADAASRIVDTINGVGMFEFASAKEFKDSGPYKSYKDAVLHHLGWARRYSDVYGGRSAERVFHDSWR